MKAFGVVAVVLAGGLAGAGELAVAPGVRGVKTALEEIRAARAAGDDSLWTVKVSGFNVLEKTVVLTEADHDIAFIGAPDATFSGGVRLTGWTAEGEGVWSCPAPRTPSGEVAFFDQLWLDGRRAPNARIPNEGFLRIASATQTVVRADAKDPLYEERAVFATDDAKALAAVPADELGDVQMGIILKWSYGKRSVLGYDAAKNEVRTASGQKLDGWKPWNAKETLIAFTNVRSGFDAPGEWFLDRKAGKVLYRPLPGEDLARMEVVAPRPGLSRLFEVKASVGQRKYSRNVTWRNLRLAFTSAPMRTNGPEPILQHQAASGFDGVVTLDGAHGYAFENCEVSHTGNYAFRFNDGCMSNAVVDCTLTDLGAGGVWMGMRNGSGRVPRKAVQPAFADSTAFNLISNNTITCGGRYNPEATAVALTHCSDTRVVCNDIHDFYYTGVSVGWVWGFAGSVAQRNEIAYNRIYDLGKRIMSDMGGVYTLGTSYGTRVHHNEIHDVWSYSYGGWALYCDEGSEGLVMEDNVCWNTTDGGFHQHYGTGCLIRNNIFAFNRETGAVRSARPEVQGIPCTFHFVNNIVYVDHGPLVNDDIHRVGGVWANNLWYDVRGASAARLGGTDWSGWVASGKETGGVFADPKFRNAAAFDFRLAPDSPALALGFKPIDLAAETSDRRDADVLPHRVMGFNIWGPFFGNPVEEREETIAAVIRKYNPDVLAIQEMHPKFWEARFPTLLKEAGYTVVDRATDGKNNYVPIFYRADRLMLLDCGFERFCPRLDVSKSVTWGVFEDPKTGERFISFATHFWWRTDSKSDDQVREDNAEKLIACLRRVQAKYPDAPIIGGGDVNTLLKSWAMEKLESHGLFSAQKVDPTAANISTNHRDPVRGEDGRYHGFLRKEDNTMDTSIDHILVETNRIDLVKTTIVTDQEALDVSDHCPVVVDFKLK